MECHRRQDHIKGFPMTIQFVVHQNIDDMLPILELHNMKYHENLYRFHHVIEHQNRNQSNIIVLYVYWQESFHLLYLDEEPKNIKFFYVCVCVCVFYKYEIKKATSILLETYATSVNIFKNLYNLFKKVTCQTFIEPIGTFGYQIV